MMKKRSTTYRLNKVDYAIFVICSIAAAVMFFLFYRDLNSFTIKQSEEPIAKIYFKRNTAQRKFVDSDIWEVLTNSSDVYDGDRIRTSKNSEAYTEFADSQIQIQLNEKSMIQIFKSKDQKSVNFIGGEIRVSNKSGEEDSLIINSGGQTISVFGSSEAKISLPDVSEAAAAGEVEAPESVVVVEVVSGQVEVKSLDAEDDSDGGTVMVAAGETLKFGKEKTEEEKIAEAEAAESLSNAVAAENPDVPQIPLKVVKTGVQKTYARSSEKFAYNTWVENGVERHNYQFDVCMADLTEKFRIIPRDALLEVEVSGVPSANLKFFAIQIGTGEDGEWRRAHSFSWTNDHGYLAQGVPFNIKKPIVLDYDIVNTDKAFMNISYEQGVQGITISNLNVKVNVVSLSGGHNTRALSSGFTKTLEYGSLYPFKDVWGGGAMDYDYLISVNTDQIFGESVTIPAGTRIRISVSGTSSTEIGWFYPSLIDDQGETWDNVLTVNWDTYATRFSENPTAANVPFSYSRTYDVLRPLSNTNWGMFRFVVPGGEVDSAPAFTGLRITFEVL